MTTERTHHDLHDLIHTDINTSIPNPILTEALKQPPFIPIPGIINIRDLGALPDSPIRHNLLYRSGALHKLPASSLVALKDDLGIKMILDLRSEREIARSPNPTIEGVKNMHFESLRVPSAIDMESFVEERGKKGYVEMYAEVLEIHKPSVRAALEWMRDAGTPMLFHCTGMSSHPPF
jgi:protein tyrosine/serine phosphatase